MVFLAGWGQGVGGRTRWIGVDTLDRTSRGRPLRPSAFKQEYPAVTLPQSLKSQSYPQYPEYPYYP